MGLSSYIECNQYRLKVARELKKQKIIREIILMWKKQGYSQDEIDLMITAWVGTLDV